MSHLILRPTSVAHLHQTHPRDHRGEMFPATSWTVPRAKFHCGSVLDRVYYDRWYRWQTMTKLRFRMCDQGETTRRQNLLLEAVDPATGQNCVLQISYGRLMALSKRGKGFVLEAADTLREVLLRPTGVFEGLCSDEDEDARGYGWRCYCGTPPWRYRADGERVPAPSDRVFLAFVNTEKVVYNWRWEPTDDTRRDWPIDHEDRFRRPLL